MSSRMLMLPLVALIVTACGDSSSSNGDKHTGGSGGASGGSGGSAGTGGGGGTTTTECGVVFQGARCLQNGWCWEAPRPEGTDFEDIDGPMDGSSLFAVGRLGVAYRRCQGAWVPIDTGTEIDLHGVWHPSPDVALAVGDKGTVLEWNGKVWSTLTVPVVSDLRAVWGASPDDAWIGGDKDTTGGVLLHYDGTKFERVASITSANVAIAAIHGRNKTDIFAVGGGAFRYDGTTWNALQTGYDEAFVDVLTLSNGETHALNMGHNGPELLRFNGTTWNYTYLATPHYGFSKLFEAADGHAEIVEMDVYERPVSKLLRNEGDTYVEIETLPASPNAVWARSADSAWGVGDISTLLGRTAGVWKQVPELVPFPSDLQFIGGSSENVWAIGSIAAAHRDANGWNFEDLPVEARDTLHRVSIDLAGRPWFVQDSPSTIFYRDAGTWKTVTIPESLNGSVLLVANAPNDVWIADTQLSTASVGHFDGSTWSEVSTPCAPFFNPSDATHMPDGDRFRRGPDGLPWLVGQYGAFEFESTSSCKQLTGVGGGLFGGDPLTDIVWTPSGELWAVTGYGKLYRRDGNYLVPGTGDPWAGVVNGMLRVLDVAVTPSGKLRITYSVLVDNVPKVSLATVDPATGTMVGTPFAAPESAGYMPLVFAPDESSAWAATEFGSLLRYAGAK